jgi:hypothetical protein
MMMDDGRMGSSEARRLGGREAWKLGGWRADAGWIFFFATDTHRMTQTRELGFRLA